MKKTLPALLAVSAFTFSGWLPVARGVELAEDIADMKVQELKAGGDINKRYFVIHRPVDPPKEGWRTLFVLPGGPGDDQFMSFVTRIAKNALPDGYLVVELVAPVWTQKEDRVVWPSDKPKVREAKFTTAEFFALVRSEIAKTQKLDPRYSFTLTWSSSGMSGYEFSLNPKFGITGSFVAMSVFHPANLPSLSKAKGSPYYIYHSPQDFIPIAQAEAARDALQKAGATVKFQTYEGGHGWQGDVFGSIRTGITWLEEEVSKKGK